MAQAYTTLRVGRYTLQLARGLSPSDAAKLVQAARADGLHVTFRTPFVAYGPGRASAPRHPIGPTRPMPHWQRQRAVLYEHHCADSDDVTRLRAALARLVRQHGVDAVRNALRKEVTQ